MRNFLAEGIEKDRILAELQENAPCVSSLSPLLVKVKKGLVTSEVMFELATLRNRNLITREEQKKIRKAVVGFFGLSVGSHAAVTWVMESRVDNIKISDPDTVDPSNLNRIRAGWSSVGKLKTEIVSDEIRSMNPSINVTLSTKVDDKTVVELFDSKPKLDLVVEETDSLEAKLLLRRLSKEREVPLLSATDVGDNVVLDVERYDLDPRLEPFLGRLPGIEGVDVSNLSQEEKTQMVVRLVGQENFSRKMQASLDEIGKTLKTWPQLGATAALAGALIATTIKKVVLGEKVESGRYVVSLDRILGA